MRVIDTLGDFFFHLEHNRQVTKWTLMTYKTTMKHFCNILGNMDTNSLTPTHIIRLNSHLKTCIGERKWWRLKDSFITSSMIRIKSYIKWLSNEWLLRGLKPSDVPIQKTILTNPTFLSPAELDLFFAYCEKVIDDEKVSQDRRKPHERRKRKKRYPYWTFNDYRAYMNYTMIYFLYVTGLRNAEMRSLKWDNIDMQNRTGNCIWKGNKHAIFTFNKKCQDMLENMLDMRCKIRPNLDHYSQYIFTSPLAERDMLSASSVNHMIANYAEWAGIRKKVTAHTFRHTLATRMLNSWCNIREAQEKLRHVSIETTQIYTHVTNSRLQEITDSL